MSENNEPEWAVISIYFVVGFVKMKSLIRNYVEASLYVRLPKEYLISCASN